ncbi:MAG: HAMP domain-containing protein [Deltaproteobacteria bacterium]|nr:HAMP domain-containing protein [Deltaproteobacteria bacterium]
MNSSIEKRIKVIVAIAFTLVVMMAGVSLYYFSIINDSLEQEILADIRRERLGQQLKAAYFDLQNEERKMSLEIVNGGDGIFLAGLSDKIDPVVASLEELNELITKFEALGPSPKNQERLVTLAKQSRSYRELLKKLRKEEIQRKELLERFETQYTGLLFERREELIKTINHILATSAERFAKHEAYIYRLITDANQNMLIMMLLMFAAAIIIYMTPRRVTRPIRVYINAIRELRELKFETRLPISSDNELSQLGQEINAFVDTFVEFDEMKRKKIQFEKRKYQVLSDILNLGVVIISIEGEVLFLNAQMAKFLQLGTESFQKKDFHFVRLPEEMKELFEDAIQKKEKFENRMIILNYEKEDENGESSEEAVELLVDAGMVRNYVGDVANIILTFEDISGGPEGSIFKRISFRKENVS